MYRFGGGPHRRSRAGLWFAAFTIASLVMLLGSGTEQARGLQHTAARAIEPVRGAVAGLGQGVAGVFGAIGEIDRLRGESDRLRGDLAQAKRRIAELTEAGVENAQLRELLGLSEALDMELLAVRIISRDPSNLSWEVGIDGGTDDGVEEGAAVVGSAEGAGALAGTVVEAGDGTARVRLIVDTRSIVVATDQQTRALGEIRGQHGGQLVFVNVPISEPLAQGDEVISAGLALITDGAEVARSPYPAGLLIGEIQAVEPDVNALTQTAFVRPAFDFRSVERLLVVLDFTQD